MVAQVKVLVVGRLAAVEPRDLRLGHKLGAGGHGSVYHATLSRQPSVQGIDRAVINILLKPGSWQPPPDGSFPLSSDEVIWLCDCASTVLEGEETLPPSSYAAKCPPREL